MAELLGPAAARVVWPGVAPIASSRKVSWSISRSQAAL